MRYSDRRTRALSLALMLGECMWSYRAGTYITLGIGTRHSHLELIAMACNEAYHVRWALNMTYGERLHRETTLELIRGANFVFIQDLYSASSRSLWLAIGHRYAVQKDLGLGTISHVIQARENQASVSCGAGRGHKLIISEVPTTIHRLLERRWESVAVGHCRVR